MPGTAKRTIAAILDEIAEMDEAEVTTALTNTEIPVLKAFRSKLFAGAKREAKSENKKTADEKTAAEERVSELEDELRQLKEKTPDVAAERKKLEDKFGAEKKKLEDKIADLNTKLTGKAKGIALSSFSKFLTGDPEELAKTHKGLALGDVNEKYATLVLAKQYEDRIVTDENGEVVDVLKPGEQTGFDAPTIEGKLALLAAEVRKTVDTTFIVPRSRSGGGSNLRPIGGTPGKPGEIADEEREAIRQQKVASGAYSI